jgi:hypothetical protein
MSDPPRWIGGGIEPMPVDGDSEMVRSLGDGVPPSGEPCGEYSSASDRDRLTTDVRDARAAAVAAAASSTVPVWWFWWRVSVVRRVNVFWQSAYGHLYGRLPEWIRRWRARELESLKG